MCVWTMGRGVSVVGGCWVYCKEGGDVKCLKMVLQ